MRTICENPRFSISWLPVRMATCRTRVRSMSFSPPLPPSPPAVLASLVSARSLPPALTGCSLPESIAVPPILSDTLPSLFAAGALLKPRMTRAEKSVDGAGLRKMVKLCAHGGPFIHRKVHEPITVPRLGAAAFLRRALLIFAAVPNPSRRCPCTTLWIPECRPRWRRQPVSMSNQCWVRVVPHMTTWQPSLS